MAAIRAERANSGQGPLGTWRLVAFALPCVPVAAMLMPVVVYLPNYYATDLGVDLTAIGLAFGVVRLFDLWLDPTLGFLIDRTNTRFGRFKPWLVAGLPIAVVSVWMLFMARPGIDGNYILFWLVLGFLGQSMATMAHVTWAARLAPEYGQRARVFSWWHGFTVVGMLIVLAMPPLMKLGFGLDYGQGVRAMGWFVVLSLPVAALLALFAVHEPPSPPNITSTTWRHYWDLIRRPSILRLLVSDILLGTGPVIAGTLFFFYFDAIRGWDRSEAGLLLLLYFTGALLGAPLWGRLGQAIGKHRALAIASAAYAVAQLSVLIAPEGLAWGIVTMTLAGLPYSAGPILLRAMMADLGDEERLRSGVDRSGLMFGLLSGVVKIGSAIAVFAAVSALDLFGFKADLGAANTPLALGVLSVSFAVVPALLTLAGAALITGHPLDKAAHDAIRKALEARDAAQNTAETSGR
ncbi:MFS transporter [Caulobacter vibrioides]|uniref:Sodium:galactoside symporter family protein n=2 Tax=Caulobacter vibrioides TaxID=155892 RepID=Q9A413_CAUVC|nr:MFS transporter [Caulobacter vibrioides]YP_002518498.1 MFS transporter [Caulobacter vibrioides NA1000]AAK24992.1 sodium:galactoside symporter family protein [Caulobacter vibrioides CB15]ACL96590.1 MFS transporter [Caulobacter vibrioides NA1000]ATC29863.1 MFS transporter [Caulobacter vibrioides]QXZ51378.1 MFS transporter [Caulobacter vibrioides]